MARTKVSIPNSFIAESIGLLKSNKILYLIPLTNLIFTATLLLLVINTFLSPTLIHEITHARQAALALAIKIAVILLCFLLIPLLSNLFNAAIIFYCDGLIKQKKITLGRSFCLALKRTPGLLLWSVIQYTIGFLLNLIDNTHEGTSEMIIDLIFGVAWGLLSFFVLPIMLLENQRVFPAIKNAVSMTKHLWHKRAVLKLGLLGLSMLFLFALAIGIIVLGFYLNDQLSFYISGVGLIFFIALAYTNRLLTMIIRLKFYHAIKDGDYLPNATTQTYSNKQG